MRKRLVPLMLVLALISSLFAASAEYAPAEAGCPSGILDGTYIPDDFAFSGGTGRVTIRCEKVEITDGQPVATIVFDSPHYTCVRIGDVKYDPICDEENSRFEIPAVLNRAMTIYGTTTAMSAAHEIEYSVFIRVDALQDEVRRKIERPCVGVLHGAGLRRRLSVDYYEGGYALIHVRRAPAIWWFRRTCRFPMGSIRPSRSSGSRWTAST